MPFSLLIRLLLSFAGLSPRHSSITSLTVTASNRLNLSMSLMAVGFKNISYADIA